MFKKIQRKNVFPKKDKIFLESTETYELKKNQNQNKK